MVGPGSADHALIVWRQWRELKRLESFAGEAYEAAWRALDEAGKSEFLAAVAAEIEVACEPEARSR